MRFIKKAATAQSVYFDVLDSTSTTGGRKTGLAWNTSGLKAAYIQNRDKAVAITLANLTFANSGWASGGFIQVDAANAPGIYRLDVPDAAWAIPGASPAELVDSVVIVLQGATGMVQASTEVQMVADDPQDSTKLGIAALPNASAGALNGLPLSVDTSGRVDVLKVNGTTQTAGDIYSKVSGLTFTGANKVDASVRDWVGDTIPARNVTGVPIVDNKYLLGTVFSSPATAGIMDVNVKNAGNTAWASGALTRAVLSADSGLQPARSNTAQAGASTTITLDAGASASDNFYTGQLISLTGGTGAGQVRVITSYVGSTKVATITPVWVTNPDNTSTFAVLDDGPADIRSIVSDATSAINLNKTTDAIGRGTVGAGSSTTSVTTSAFTPAPDGSHADQFKDSVILFDANTTTVALRRCAKAISANSNASTPTFTVNALPVAPASGDTFSII